MAAVYWRNPGEDNQKRTVLVWKQTQKPHIYQHVSLFLSEIICFITPGGSLGCAFTPLKGQFDTTKICVANDVTPRTTQIIKQNNGCTCYWRLLLTDMVWWIRTKLFSHRNAQKKRTAKNWHCRSRGSSSANSPGKASCLKVLLDHSSIGNKCESLYRNRRFCPGVQWLPVATMGQR